MLKFLHASQAGKTRHWSFETTFFSSSSTRPYSIFRCLFASSMLVLVGDCDGNILAVLHNQYNEKNIKHQQMSFLATITGSGYCIYCACGPSFKPITNCLSSTLWIFTNQVSSISRVLANQFRAIFL